MSHSGSNKRAFELTPMSALEHCGSSRVQLVIEDVVGTPAAVFFAFLSTTAGIGKRRTVIVFWTVVIPPYASMARAVMIVSPMVGTDTVADQ